MAMKTAQMFDKMTPFLKEYGANLVQKVGFKGKQAKVWTVDLKNGNGSIKVGKEGKADATFAMVDDDAVAVLEGRLNPQNAFMQGKMKIRGNMQAAMKFTPDLFPKGKL